MRIGFHYACRLRFIFTEYKKSALKSVRFSGGKETSAPSGSDAIRPSLDSGRQTALLTGSGVLVENVAAGETVEDAGGLLEFFSSSGLVASGDELLDSLMAVR